MSTRSDAATRRAQAEAIREFNEAIEAGTRTIAATDANHNDTADYVQTAVGQ